MTWTTILVKDTPVTIDRVDLWLVEETQYAWQIWQGTSGIKYCLRHVPNGRTRRWERLHRLILEAPSWAFVDHKNGNGLDNRRDNLRLCHHKQNMANQRGTETGTSKYRGVSQYRDGVRWVAQIKVNYCNKHIGVYLTEEEAAQAYDKAAREAYGEFARVNL